MSTLIYPFYFCINSCYLLILPLLPFPLITPDVHHNGHVWSCQPLTWVIEYDVMGTLLVTVSCYIDSGHTLGLRSIHLCTTHDNCISDWPAATLIGKYMHMIITFSDWPAATLIRMWQEVIYSCFHLFVWPNHNRPVARWDFSCVVKWPELEWVFKSKHLVCFKPYQDV